METHQIYTVEYFIEKFSAIAEHRWLIGNYSNFNGTKKCALGHCDGNGQTEISNALHKLFKVVVDPTEGWGVGGINDGRHPNYQQPTPKQRILAALRDIQAMQNPKPEQQEAKPERIVYVTVDADVRDLQKKELVQN